MFWSFSGEAGAPRALAWQTPGGVSVVPVPGALGATHPALRLLARSPVKVHGTGFGRDEGVTVTYGTWHLRVRTTRFGAFVAQFPLADRCSSGRVVATGRPGQRAVLYIPPTLCPVAQSQGPA